MFRDLRGWPAALDCDFGVLRQRTVLTRLRFNGPLRVQRLFYPEKERHGIQPCHCYLLHPPGGLVSGDALDMRFSVGPAAHCLLTTPSAGKIYRMGSQGAPQRQTLAAEVDNGALEWLPQETILFDGSGARLSACFHLRGASRLVAWDIVCFGRPAAGESFGKGRFSQSLRIERDGEPLLLEQTDCEAGDSLWESPAGFYGCTVSASFIACGHEDDDKALRDACAALQAAARPERARVGATFRNRVLIARWLGRDSGQARRFCLEAWRTTRPLLLKRRVCPPRIWNT
ncbi:MAG: urease accessory protein UreD [Desulfovibrio sp.]|nr:urease accessory protein UreD [Desulfovibrio sp.]